MVALFPRDFSLQLRAGVYRLFSGLKTLLSHILLTAGEQLPSMKDTEMWLGVYQLDRKASQPTPQSGVLTTLEYGIKMLLNQNRHPLEILGT